MSIIERFLAAEEALKSGRPRPGDTARPFCAAAMAGGEADPAGLADAARARLAELKAPFSIWVRPSESLLWVHAALLARADESAREWVQAREALAAARKERRTRSLAQSGASAALILTLSTRPSATKITRFFELREGLKLPWWRRHDDSGDAHAALHAAGDGTVSTIIARVEAARAVFGEQRGDASAREAAAQLCVLTDTPPETARERFEALRLVKKRDRKRYGALPPLSLAELAMREEPEAGLNAMADIFDDLRAHKRWASGSTLGWVAHILATGDDAALPGAALSGLQAVLAAQAAAMAAISGATVAATSGS